MRRPPDRINVSRTNAYVKHKLVDFRDLAAFFDSLADERIDDSEHHGVRLVNGVFIVDDPCALVG